MYKISKKQILEYSVILFSLTIFSFQFNVDFLDFLPGSKFYLGEIITGLVLVIYIYLIYKGKYKLSLEQKKYAKLIIIFVGFLIIANIYRISVYGLSKEYIVLIRNFLVSSAILLFLNDKRFKPKDILNIVIIIIVFSNLYQLIYLFINNEIRSSKLFTNVVLYNASISVLIVVILYSYIHYIKEDKKTFLFDILMITSLVLSPFSGSRISFLLLLTILTFIIIERLFYKDWRIILGLLKNTLVSIIMIFSIAYMFNNQITNDVLERSTGIKLNIRNSSTTQNNSSKLNVLNLTNEVNVDTKGTVENNNELDIDDGSESDAFRFQIMKQSIENIKKNPLIGYGKLLVQLESKDKVFYQQPHNFFLEWLLGYGLIGTILYINFFITPLKNIKIKEILKKTNYYLLGIYLVFALNSMFQPTASRILFMQMFFICIVFFSKSSKLEQSNNKEER